MTPIRKRSPEWARPRTCACLVVVVVVGISGCEPGHAAIPPAISSAAVYPAIIRPETVTLGVIRRPAKRETELELVNPHDRAISVSRIAVSCPCLRASPEMLKLEPRSTGTLVLRLDPGGEPDFSGRLTISVAGETPDGRRVFETAVQVTVEPAGAGVAP